jgi:hypothetical protein
VAHHRHKRDTDARRLLSARSVSAGIAFLATAPVVAFGVLQASPAARDLVSARPLSASLSTGNAQLGSAAVAQRYIGVSRSSSRKNAAQDATRAKADVAAEAATRKAVAAAEVATRKAVAAARDKLWTTAPLNLWTEADEQATQIGEIAASRQVLVTGRHADGRDEIVLDGRARWVTTGYLSTDKPLGVGAGLSMAPCPDPGVESGLTSAAVYVYRSVCHAFPQITTYGGWDNHGEHSSGRALDIMTSDVALGTAIAEFLQSHSAELHLYDILWRQHIWTPVRSSEGWRFFASRGSATADHYDHVHVSVY